MSIIKHCRLWQYERERTVLEQEVLNGKILRSALQEAREYRWLAILFLGIHFTFTNVYECSKVLTDERAALKADLMELKGLFRLAAEVCARLILEMFLVGRKQPYAPIKFVGNAD